MMRKPRGNFHVRIVVLFVMLLMLVGIGSAQGGKYEYEDVMNQINRMRKQMSELEGLAQSQQKEIKRLKGVKSEGLSDKRINELEGLVKISS